MFYLYLGPKPDLELIYMFLKKKKEKTTEATLIDNRRFFDQFFHETVRPL
jgi:hypothetical protein